MTKFFLGLQLTFWTGWFLGDSITGCEFQAAFIAGYAIARLVPVQAWISIGQAFCQILPWIMLASIDF